MFYVPVLCKGSSKFSIAFACFLSRSRAQSYQTYVRLKMNIQKENIKGLTHIMQGVAQQNYPTGALYVIATPIGNIGDISLRALYVLSLVDAIACEDTRITNTLLMQYGISKELIITHQHNERFMTDEVINRLAKGERIALVTDAGTPAISDPGYFLVNAALSSGFRVVPIPGASAVVTALSASGLPADHFYFVGFLPSKNAARESLLNSLKNISATLVMYEAPHRIEETLASLKKVFDSDCRIVIAREITKLFEQIHSCKLSEVQNWIAEDANRQKGEFVLLVENMRATQDEFEMANRILSILLKECSVKQSASLASQITGIKKNQLYEQALKIKAES